jgi:hypothetical protein
MNKGNWPFIHEWTIYEYLIHKTEENTLRLKVIYKNKRIIRKDIWKKVNGLKPIDGTDFPDIKGIKLENEQKFRPAEIKFTTSLFNYHKDKKYSRKFEDFTDNNGFLIVLSHDYLPKYFEKIKDMEIYAIDRYDFTTFCKENFDRLLNRQINQHTENKIWIMYQGPNFDSEDKKTKSARKSHLWCPTENLTSFDLAIGDRLIFIKTIGGSTQDVQNNFDKIKDKWTLTELVITEVKSKIRNRIEYCQLNKISYAKKLWVNDPFENDIWRWNRVFEFKIIKSINKSILLSELMNSRAKGFVEAVIDVYCHQYSRELMLNEYRDLIETLV